MVVDGEAGARIAFDARDIGAAPPEASLAAEGGDPVAGQLGTYTWRGGGTDSPWLQGAPMTVGSAEPLTVSFEPPVDIASWQARSVAARSAGPVGATALGEGSGQPTFTAPGPGAWTVEVHTDNLGSDEYNLTLSQRRADAIVAGLVARGADPAQLLAVGKGEGEPIADNATRAGREANRRVEIDIDGLLD